MGILEDIDLVAFARETAERQAAGGEKVGRTEMIRGAWLLMELAELSDQRLFDITHLTNRLDRYVNQEEQPDRPLPVYTAGIKRGYEFAVLSDGKFAGHIVQIPIDAEEFNVVEARDDELGPKFVPFGAQLQDLQLRKWTRYRRQGQAFVECG